MSNDLAEKTTIEKTVDMCRLSTKSNLVKSVLASTQFNDPKEVLAKLITESNMENNEAQIMYYRSGHNNRYNTHRNNSFRGNWRGRPFRQNYSSNNYGSNNNNNNHNDNNRNRGRNFNSNFRGRGRSNNYRNQNNRNHDHRENERYIRVIEEENDHAPSPQRGQNTVQMQARQN